jgi:tRNA pseudouridine13 synthase
MDLSCGISQFMSLEDEDRFQADLKRYFEDFHVREIPLPMTVYSVDNITPTEITLPCCHLKQPLTKADVSVAMKQARKTEQVPIDIEGWNQIDFSALSDLIGADTLRRLIDEYLNVESSDATNPTPTPYFILSDIPNKDQRTAIHKLIKSHHPYLMSDTEECQDGRRLLRIWTKSKYQLAQKDHRIGSSDESAAPAFSIRANDPYPSNYPEYLIFLLYKENKDTMEALNQLAKATYRNVKAFQIAGIKDRRGVTYQIVSGYRITHQQLGKAILHRDFDHKNIKLEILGYSHKPLNLGHLLGNRFEIVLRGIDKRENEVCRIEKLLDSLSKNGFLNYFGQQRFGTRSVKTHFLGAAVIKKDHKELVSLLLGGETCEIFQEYFADPSESGITKSLQVIARLPKRVQSTYRTEQKILEVLLKDPRNFSAAVNSIDTQFYMHAFQSYLFNTAVSERIKAAGRQVVVGDLVRRDRVSGDQAEEILSITSSNIHEYTLFDVVLPIPGKEVLIYPTHHVNRIFYDSLCREEFNGLSLEDLECDELSGGYRNIAVLPTNFRYEIITDPEVNKNIRIIQSDLSKLLPNNSGYCPVDKLWKESDISVILKCDLQPSSYLTMAIREVAKTEVQVDAGQAGEKVEEEEGRGIE